MRFVWSTAAKDLSRHRRNPLEFLLWIGIPLVVGLLIALASGGRGGPAPQAHVLVVDQDQSFASRLLVGALGQEAAGNLIRTEAVNLVGGRAQMDAGNATALLVIPAGFGAALLREEPCTLGLVTNPSQSILPRIVEEGLSILADAHFYLHRLVGDDLRRFAEGPPTGADRMPDADIAEFSTRVNRLMARLGSSLNPLLIELVEEEPAESESGESVGIGVLFLPGLLFMALLFMAQGLGDELWREREQHTLQRVLASPQSVQAFLGGKLLANAILIAAVCAVALGAGYAYLGLDPRSLPLALLWSTLSGVMLMGMMMTLHLFAASQRAGNILTMALLFPLMMLGGSFFPFEAMPEWMAAIGQRTPNGWALEELKNIILERSSPASLLPALLGLLIFFLVLFIISAQRLRSRFARA